MEQEKRMAGEYEIIHAMQVGPREIVVGVNAAQEYLCGYCTENALLRNCTENVLSHDYLEIMAIFAQRLNGQIEAAKAERKTVHVPLAPLSVEMCLPLDDSIPLVEKVVAIKSESLRYEYRRIDRQLLLVTGGFGANPNARGTSVYGINLFTGRSSAGWQRSDIMGEVRPEHIPEWAHRRLQTLEREKALNTLPKKKERGEAR